MRADGVLDDYRHRDAMTEEVKKLSNKLKTEVKAHETVTDNQINCSESIYLKLLRIDNIASNILKLQLLAITTK